MSNDLQPADVTALLRTLELSDGLDGGVGAGKIAFVESAWQIPDTVVSSYGWVLALKDGRRVYVEYTLDDSKVAREEIKVTDLQADEAHPELGDEAGMFWYWPDRLNAYLGIAAPSLH